MMVEGYYYLNAAAHQSIVEQCSAGSEAARWANECASAHSDSLAQCMHTTVNNVAFEQSSGQVTIVDKGNFVTLDWQWRKSLGGPVIRTEPAGDPVYQFYFTSQEGFVLAVEALARAAIWFTSQPGKHAPSLLIRVDDVDRAGKVLNWAMEGVQ